MSLTSGTLLSAYLLGCLLVVLLSCIKMIIFWGIAWISKDTIMLHNVAKISPPPEPSSVIGRAVRVMLTVAIEALLSWINVIVVSWQIAAIILGTVRQLLTSVPERVKELSFALKNSPDMSREAVWAHVMAMSIAGGGEVPPPDELALQLAVIHQDYKSFDRTLALTKLAALSAENAGAILNTRQQLESQGSLNP